RGPTDEFPSASMLTGLLANALGWRRTDVDALQRLQDRLIVGARRDRDEMFSVLSDTQNAKLEKSDSGWTTRGQPEGRRGASYDAPHRRRRDYHADALVLVALTISSPDAPPTLEALAEALTRPSRPLFFGRKPCLPSAPVLASGDAFIAAPNAYEALSTAPRLQSDGPSELRALWPRGEGPETEPTATRLIARADRRNWRSGLHGGSGAYVEGWVSPPPIEPSLETPG
ncbi:MAG: type I-E CRISPR-associated protein Cas5/CasD, partial [Pseudomonadota bacterium]